MRYLLAVLFCVCLFSQADAQLIRGRFARQPVYNQTLRCVNGQCYAPTVTRIQSTKPVVPAVKPASPIIPAPKVNARPVYAGTDYRCGCVKKGLKNCSCYDAEPCPDCECDRYCGCIVVLKHAPEEWVPKLTVWVPKMTGGR